MTNSTTTTPVAGMSVFDALIGDWGFSGDVTGHAQFDWLPGGHFLRQRGTLTRDGVTHQAVEIIGAEKPFGAAEPAEQITSRAYTDSGDTLDYTYELDGQVLTVWGGPKGSPAFSRAEFDADRTVLSGEWHWPGGGYRFTMTKR
jgi:hypothetical protein